MDDGELVDAACGKQTVTNNDPSPFERFSRWVLEDGTQDDAEAWLLTFPLFATSSTTSPSRELFAHCEKRYAELTGSNKELSDEIRSAGLARLNNFLVSWCRSHPSDLSPRQIATILQWSNSNAALGNEIKLLLLRHKSRRNNLCDPTRETDDNSRRQWPLLGTSPSSTEFMEMSESALAREFTIVEFQLFKEVHLRSLLTVKNTQGDSLFEPLIAQYNTVSHWVAREILISKRSSVQVQVMEKFLRLAYQCLLLNNFNTFMEIVSGLNHNSLQRLKSLWARLSDKAKEQWREMDQLMSPQHNFRHYRRELKKRKSPVLPYFGIYLRDFTFINDGNQQYLPDGPINDKYVHLLYERAKEVKNFQSVPYNLDPAGGQAGVQHYILSLAMQERYNEDELYSLSLLAQPSLWIVPPSEGEGSAGSATEGRIRSSPKKSSIRKTSLSISDADTAEDMTGGSDRPRSRKATGEGSAREDGRTGDEDDGDGDTTSISEMSEFEDKQADTTPQQQQQQHKQKGGRAPTTTTSSNNNNNSKPLASKDDSLISHRNEAEQQGQARGVVKDFSSVMLTDGTASIGHTALPRMMLNDVRMFQSCDDLTTMRDHQRLQGKANGVGGVTSSGGGGGGGGGEERGGGADEKEPTNRPRVGSGGSKIVNPNVVRDPSPRRSLGSSIRRLNTSSATAITQALNSAASAIHAAASLSSSDGAADWRDSLNAPSRKRKKRASLKKSPVSGGGATPRPDVSALLSTPDATQRPRSPTAPQSLRTFDAAEPLARSAERSSAKAGTISISDDRYLLLRAPSLSVDFFSAIAETFAVGGVLLSPSHKESVTQRILFDFSHAVGMSDARSFRKTMDLSPGLELMSVGPVHLAYAGWSVVQLYDASRPKMNEDCYVVADHLHSFESYSWMTEQLGLKKNPHHPVCVMNAGFISGWTGESMGHTDLVAAEVMCRARGDEACRFIMAHPSKIQAHLDNFFSEHHTSTEQRKAVIVHRFLSSKETFRYTVEEPNIESGSNPTSTAGGGGGNAGSEQGNSGTAASPVTTSVEKEKDKGDLVRNLISRWRGRAPGTSSNNLLAIATPPSPSPAAAALTTPGPLPSSSSSSPPASPASSSPPVSSSPMSAERRALMGSSGHQGQHAGASSPTSGLDKSMLAEGNKSKQRLKAIFAKQALDPKQGQVSIDGHRYVFLRGEAVSYEFFHLMGELFPAGKKAEAELFAAKFLFDFARCLGKTDQRFYTAKMAHQQELSFLEKFLVLPPLMGHMGWGVMKVHTKRAHIGITPDQLPTFFLKFVLQRSMEADVWKKREEEKEEEEEGEEEEASAAQGAEQNDNEDDQQQTNQTPTTINDKRPPVCVMSAGYITGFANECLRTSQATASADPARKGRRDSDTSTRVHQLSVIEVSCAALGHGRCTFVMAPRESVGQCARQYLERKKRPQFYPHLRLGLVIEPKRGHSVA